MNRRIGAVISSLITLTVFVGLPFLVYRLISSEALQIFRYSGIHYQNLFNQMIIFGIFLTFIILIRGFIEKNSITYLVLSIVSSSVTLLLTIFFLGLGNISSLGISDFSITEENAIISLILNMRLFIYLTFFITILKVIKDILEWSESRADTEMTKNSSEAA